MNEQQFIKNNQNQWDELSELLLKKKMSFNETIRLDELYHQAVSNLAQAQAYFPYSSVHDRLQPLVAKAHNVIYNSKKPGSFSIKNLFAKQIPSALKKRFSYILFAAFLLLGSTIFACIYTHFYPDKAGLFVPAEYLQINYLEFDQRDWEVAQASSFIMSNNINVMLSMFALSLTGIGTPMILLTNGFMLGTVFELASRQGASHAMAAWILPHGILELTSIIYGAAAGFILLFALLFPGKYKRSYALQLVSKDCLLLLGLAAPMLVIAGLIEGFISGSDLSRTTKYAVGLTTILLVILPWLLVPKAEDVGESGN